MVTAQQYGKVTGTFKAPTTTGAVEGRVFLRPSVRVVVLRDEVETVLGAQLEGTVVGGVLTAPPLFPTDLVDAEPTGFTWQVSFDLRHGSERLAYPSFSFRVPAGSEQDLTTIAPVPAAPGTVVVVDTDTADRAEAAALAAEASAVATQALLDGFVPPEGGGTGGTVDTVARQAAADAQTTANGRYAKPSTGIPSSDLATAVRSSLGLADSALQAAPVTSVSGKTGAVSLSKDDVGLSNVTNLAPADLPVSTATSTALSGKAAAAHTHTAAQINDATATGRSVLSATDAGAARAVIGAGTASTKSDVGLGNVANTAPADLPVSTAAQSALDGKAASIHTHTGAQISDATTVGRSVLTAADAASARTSLGAGTASSKADVGLGNVFNLAPADLPVSNAAQAALDVKAALSHTHTSAAISDSTSVGRSVLTATTQSAGRTALGITGTGADGAKGETGAAGVGGATILPAGTTTIPAGTPAGVIVRRK